MFKKVIKMEPKNALAHKDLGTIYLNQHLISEANDEFQIALELEPENSVINFEYANYLSATGDFISAKTLYNKAYEIDNDNFEILKFMGINYIKLNDIENALLTLEKAYNINSNDALVLYNLGNVYYTNKEFEKARQMLEKPT
ncbi:MAG: tetratricopeptide repeat protein [Candidatus Melainabacteria bacterium]|nr:MAG: tetratricopeptide repeat protein [Candidatus Melainabacteria bacterium]